MDTFIKHHIMLPSFTKKLKLSSFFLFLSIFITSPGFGGSGNNPELEYSIKASLINNFIQFVQWPESAFSEGEDTLNICVAGQDPFGEKLDKITEDKKIIDKDYVFKRFPSSDGIKNCHVVFIGSSKKKNLEKILEKTRESPILLISETPGFAEKGVGINFIYDKDRIWFECNPEAMKKAGLKVSSYLLSVGKIVKSKVQSSRVQRFKGSRL